MSKRINEKFLDVYIELDRCCCEKFGISAGGITEYINRLSNARFAPGRDEVLPRLVRYRNLRNVFAHEPSAIRRNGELMKADVKWLKRFLSYLKRQKDPISKYLKKARRYARNRRIRRYVIAAAVVLLLFAAMIIYIQFAK